MNKNLTDKARRIQSLIADIDREKESLRKILKTEMNFHNFELEKKLEIAIEALRKYSNKDNYKEKPTPDGQSWNSFIEVDNGRIARKALEKIEGEK